MSKIITFRLTAEEEESFNGLLIHYNLGASELIKMALGKLSSKDARVILPKILGKDELAKYLGISPLAKEWSLFMDRITDEKVYDPNLIRNAH